MLLWNMSQQLDEALVANLGFLNLNRSCQSFKGGCKALLILEDVRKHFEKNIQLD